MTMQPTIDALRRLGACSEAIKWAAAQLSPDQAWADCERGDQMAWLLGRIAGPPESDSRRKLVLCLCEIARTALPFVDEGDTRPHVAIDTAERWALGEPGVSTDDVRAAASASYDASYADAAESAYAAAAAAYTAAASARADDACRAAASAAASARAADACRDAASAARAKSLKSSADIIRKRYPTPPKLGA